MWNSSKIGSSFIERMDRRITIETTPSRLAQPAARDQVQRAIALLEQGECVSRHAEQRRQNLIRIAKRRLRSSQATSRTLVLS